MSHSSCGWHFLGATGRSPSLKAPGLPCSLGSRVWSSASCRDDRSGIDGQSVPTGIFRPSHFAIATKIGRSSLLPPLWGRIKVGGITPIPSTGSKLPPSRWKGFCCGTFPSSVVLRPTSMIVSEQSEESMFRLARGSTLTRRIERPIVREDVLRSSSHLVKRSVHRGRSLGGGGRCAVRRCRASRLRRGPAFPPPRSRPLRLR